MTRSSHWSRLNHILLLLLVVAGVALLVKTISRGEDLDLYHTNFSPSDVKSISGLLDQAGIDSRVLYGNQIRVPRSRRMDARARLVEQNLPREAVTSRIDRMNDPLSCCGMAFGQGRSAEQRNSDLVAVLTKVAGVAQARVVVDIQERRYFQDIPAVDSAEVSLDLEPGTPLPPAALEGIVKLLILEHCASRPQDVRILDSSGKNLTPNGVSAELQGWAKVVPVRLSDPAKLPGSDALSSPGQVGR